MALFPIISRFLILVASATLSALQAGEAISIVCSQTAVPIIEAAAKLNAAQHPEASFTFLGTTTGESVKAVGNGDSPLGATVRPLNAEEIKRYPTLKEWPLAFDALVLVVQADNPVQNLSTKQIQDLYTGVITNWQALGGADVPVKLISRTESNAIVDQFCQGFALERRIQGEGRSATMLFKVKGAADFGKAEASMPGLHKASLADVALDKGGVTFSPFGTALAIKAKGGAIKVVAVDGVMPTDTTLRDQTYAHRRTISLITNGEPSGPSKWLVEFLLSPAGAAVIEEQQFVTLVKRP